MSNFKLKLVSRRTRQERVLSLQEFKQEFQNELYQAINTYSAHQKSKDFFNAYFRNPDYKSDFYMSLQFNFNNYAMSEWYIERIF